MFWTQKNLGCAQKWGELSPNAHAATGLAW